MCSLRNSLLLLLCIGVAAPAAARPRGPAAVWPGVSDVLLNVRVPAMTAARHIRVAAWGEDSEEPGSVLVFPSVHTGRVNTADAGVLPRTRFEISVTCPPDDPDFDCSSVGTVYLRAHWVCGGDATGVCAEVDFNLSTTINGTITFNTENIGPRTDDVPAPPNCVSNPGEEEEGGGYLIVWVIDSPSSGRAIKFDGLIGDEVIAGSSTSARAHGAIPIQAGEGLATLDLTDLNGDTNLDFDDAEYREVTGKVYGSLPYEQPGIPERETSLILLTLDVHSNVQNPVTSAGLSFYNEGERLLSSAVRFTCWGEFHLSDLRGGASLNVFDFGTKGLLVSDPAVQNGNPVTMLGVVEREEEFTFDVAGVGQGTVSIALPLDFANLPPGCEVIFRTIPQPFPFPPLIIPVAVRCTITVNTVTSVDATREWSYPLLNDSKGVKTTFLPRP